MSVSEVRVQQTRTVTFYVQGADPAMVREDAEILAEELENTDWDLDVDMDVDIREVARPKEGYRLWSGGPDGNWGST